jgi:hypothetical protein
MLRYIGSVEVNVKSKKVACEVVKIPYYSGVHHYLGPTAVLQKRKVVYKRRLDEEQERLVRNAMELAESQGLELHVHDVSSEGVVRRLLRFVSREGAFTPTLVIRGLVGFPLAARRGSSRSS